MRKLLALVVTLGCACEPVTQPLFGAPHILSISPLEQDSIEPVALQVQLDQEPRFRVDYGQGSGMRLEQLMLWVGDQAVPLDTYLGHGLFQGMVPADLAEGHYDLKVTLEDGREATWTEGYRVTPQMNFYVETIGNQLQDQPFTITLRAMGEGSEFFQGTVTMYLTVGGDTDHALETRITGAFSGGMRQEQLSISAPGTNYLVVLKRGTLYPWPTSMNFRVDPRN